MPEYSVFDVDKLVTEFKPVVIRFGGEDYILGNSVEEVLCAADAAKSVPDDAPMEKQLTLLPKVLQALNADLGREIGELGELTLAQRLVLQRAVTEVMSRVADVPFRSEPSD